MNKKILLIVLIVLTVVLCIFLITNKKDSPSVQEDNSVAEKVDILENDTEYIKLDYFDYCEDEKCYFIDLEELKKEKINDIVNLDIKCNKNEVIDDDDYCTNINIVVDDKININIETVKDYYYDEGLIVFKTPNNYIIKQINSYYGTGLLNIYSNSGKLLKEIKNNVTSYELIVDGEVLEDTEVYEVVLNNNKLYYAWSDDLDFVNGLDNKVHIGYIDLNEKLDFHEQHTLNAITSLGI